jgi:hypothetical protein
LVFELNGCWYADSVATAIPENFQFVNRFHLAQPVYTLDIDNLTACARFVKSPKQLFFGYSAHLDYRVGDL